MTVPLCALFQSTRPVWGATVTFCLEVVPDDVSIHAPRVGRDIDKADFISMVEGFNPRAPCGARLGLRRYGACLRGFQSTRPVWGATLTGLYFDLTYSLFQSTRPVWGATFISAPVISPILFQSTRPVWGATFCIKSLRAVIDSFNPRAPCGARHPRKERVMLY